MIRADLWADLASTFGQTAFSGSMFLAIPVAVIAGLVAFASPCVLPLVPGYLGYVSGMTGAALVEGGSRPGRGRVLGGVALFVAGFTVVFVALGVLAGSLGAALNQWRDPISRVLGIVVIVMGLAFLGLMPFLQRERRLRMNPTAGLWGAPLLGIVFGLGWAPCIGPTLVAITALSLDEGSAVRGGVLSVAYCIGLGVPFLLLALGFQRSAGALRFLRKHRLAIMRIGGAVLVVIGLLLVSGLWASWTQSLQGWIGGFETVV